MAAESSSGVKKVELTYTPVEEIQQLYDSVKKTWESGRLKPVSYRKQQLAQLAYMMEDNKERFQAALTADLGRPSQENSVLELTGTLGEIVSAHDNVERWSKTERAPFTLNFFAMRPAIRKESKGVVLIISPFNYPYNLSLGPMAGAIAAGNAVILKPSEVCANCAALLVELMPLYLDNDLFKVVNGAIPETTKLLELKWDHIMYTGNGRVGRIVAAAAAKHLTPITLELGGKSPCVVDPNVNMMLTARRILWGKFSNAGQTCVAPDYILVPSEGQEALVEALKAVHKEYYPDDPKPSMSRIVSPNHFGRVSKLLAATNGDVICGGETDESEKYIAPTVVNNVNEHDSLMSEEIFGPILPIIPVENVDAAIKFINSRDHPLVIYTFSQDSKFHAKIFDNTRSGAAIANEVLVHSSMDILPFGGVGESGYGQHRGKYSFDTFTHMRSTMDVPGWMDWVLKNRYPPYTPSKERFLEKFTYPSLPSRVQPKPAGI